MALNYPRSWPTPIGPSAAAKLRKSSISQRHGHGKKPSFCISSPFTSLSRKEDRKILQPSTNHYFPLCIQTCRKRLMLVCMNPGSTLPLAMMASSHNHGNECLPNPAHNEFSTYQCTLSLILSRRHWNADAYRWVGSGRVWEGFWRLGRLSHRQLWTQPDPPLQL